MTFLQHFGIEKIFLSKVIWQVKTSNREEMKLMYSNPSDFFSTLSAAGSKNACTRRSYVGGDRHQCKDLKTAKGSKPGQRGRKTTISFKNSSEKTHRPEYKYKRIAKTTLLLRLQVSPTKGTPSMPSPYPPSREGSYQPLQGPAGLWD